MQNDPLTNETTGFGENDFFLPVRIGPTMTISYYIRQSDGSGPIRVRIVGDERRADNLERPDRGVGYKNG